MTGRKTIHTLRDRNEWKKSRSRGRGRKLFLEQLEDRRLLATINVPADHATIQAAIDAASDGDIINVAPGTYSEKLSIAKNSLTIQSTGGPADTIVAVPDSYAPGGVYITGDSNTFDGFSIRDYDSTSNTYERKIIRIGSGADGNAITNNVIQGNLNQTGVTQQTDYGVLVDGSDNVIDSNEIYDIGYMGVNITGTGAGNTITENDVHHIGIYAFGLDRSPSNIVSENSISNLVGGTLWGSYYDPAVWCWGVIVWGAAANGNQIAEQTVSGLPNGIVVSSAQNTIIENSTVNNNAGIGIKIAKSSWAGGIPTGNTISNTFVEGNDVGVSIPGALADIGIGNAITKSSIEGNTTKNLDNVAGAAIDASANWWGSNDETTVVGTINGLATVDITPFLNAGTDTDGVTAGFQGDFSTLRVTASGDQTGATARIQEGVDLLADGALTGGARTVHVLAGTYTDGGADTSGKALTLAAGASPGQVNVTGDLVLDGDATLAVELDGTSPASPTEFDNWLVSGSVTLGGATLTLTGGDDPAPGDTYTIITRTGGGASTFAGYAEGATVVLNGDASPLQITYVGGDGNDVVLFYDTTPIAPGTAGDDEFFVRLVGSDIEVRTGDAFPNGTVVLQTPLVNLTSLTIDGGDGDDVLTVDFTNGNPIPTGGLFVNGGGQQTAAGDSLIITGNATPFANQIFTFTGEDSQGLGTGFDGNVNLDGSVINFTGLEPISGGDSDNTTLNLPDGTAHNATLQDHATPGRIEIVGATFEDTDIPNPTVSLTVNGGDDNDVITVASVDAAFRASLIIDGGDGSDTIDLSTNLLLGAAGPPVSAGNLTLTAEAINIGAAVTSIATNAAANAGSIAFNGPVVLAEGGAVTLTTDGSTSDGTISFSSSLSGTSGGGAENITFNSGSGTTSVTGSVSTIGTLTVTNSGGATFSGAVGGPANRISDVVLTATTGTIEFGNDLYATSVTNAGGTFALNLYGSFTDVTNAVTFGTSGTVAFGNGSDSLTFSAGVTHTTGANAINGNITATNSPIDLDNTTSVGGNSTLAAGSGEISLGATTLADGVTLKLGANGAGNVQVASIAGTPGPGETIVEFHVTGTVEVAGTVGTAIDTLKVTNSGGTTFTGAVGGALDRINSMVLTATTGTVRFSGDLYATGVTNLGNGFALDLLGPVTDVTNTVMFGTSGTVTFGDGGGDALAFTGGVTHTTGANEINGNLSTTNASINLNSATAVTGTSQLSAGTGTITLGAATLANGVTLTVGAGAATPISLSSVTGPGAGSAHLTLNTSAAATVGGAVATNIGTLTITNSSLATFSSTVAATQIAQAAGTVKFDDAVTVGAGGATFNANVTLDGLTFTSAGHVILGNAAADALTLSGGAVIIDTSAAGTNVTINATTNGAPSLQITAGAGTIDVQGNIGTTTKPLSTDFSADTIHLHDVATTGSQLYTATTSITTNSSYTSEGQPITFAGALTLNDPAIVNTTANSAAGADVSFQSTVNGAETLTVTAGTGDATFTGAVGGTTRLGALSIVSAADVTAAAITAASLSQTAGTATTTLNGAVDTNTAAGVSLTGTNVAVNAGINTTNGGTVTITNAGLLDIAPGADMTLDGAFLQNGAGPVQTAGDITTTADNITFTTAVTLTDGDAVALSTGAGVAGNILFLSTLNGAVDGAENLTLTAGSGSITAIGAVGAITPLASIQINSAADVAFSSTVRTTANVTQAAGTGTTTFHGTSGTGIGGNLSVTTGAIALSSAVVTTVGTVNLNAQNAISVNASAGIAAGASTIAIAANQDGSGAQGFTQAGGTTIQTTNATASAISITVGGTGGAAIAALQADTTSGRVTVTAGGAISDNNAAAMNITANAAALTAVGGIGSGGALETTISNLAFSNATSGNVEMVNTGGLTIDAVGTLLTSSSAGGVTITATSPITFAVNTSSVGTATYTSDDDNLVGNDDNITVNAGVTVEVTGAASDLIFRSGDRIIINATAIVRSTGAGGNVTLASGYNDADNDGSMTLDGTITANATLTLNLNDEAGAATQAGTGVISAAGLRLLSGATGSGSFTLSAGTNDVNVIAASVNGAVVYADTDDLQVGTVTTVGITTSDDDVRLCATSLSLTQSIAAGAGTVRLYASGAGGISQTAGTVTAATLGLAAPSGSISLPNANDVDTLAAVVGGTFAFSDSDGFTIGTVTADGCFPGATGITGATNVELCVTTGDLVITEALTASGTVRLRTGGGNMTQSGAGVITAANLGARATGNVDLNTLTNVVSGTFAAASTTAGVVEFASSSGFTIGTISAGTCFAATTGISTNGGNIVATAGGALSIVQAVTSTPTALSGASGGTITLTAAGAITSTAGTGTVTSSGATSAGAGGNAGEILINSTAAGGITLNAAVTANGGIGTPNGNAAVITIRNGDGAVALHNVSSTGATSSTIQVSATGNVTQAGGTSLLGQNLKVISGGSVTLTNAANNVATVAADLASGTAAFSYRDADALTIGTVAAAGALGVNLLPVSGIDTDGGSIGVTSGAGLTIDQAVNSTPDAGTGSSGGTITLTAPGTITSTVTTGTVTSSGATSAGTGGNAGQILINSTAAGAITLNAAVAADGGAGASNGNAGLITIRNASGTVALHNVSSTGTPSQTIQISATGNVTQTALTSVLAQNLKLISGGSVTLTNATNNVATVAADLTSGTGSFSYTDADALTIGTVSAAGTLGVNLPEVSGITTRGGAVTVLSGPLTVSDAILTTPAAGGGGAGGSVSLTAAGAIATTAPITTTGATGNPGGAGGAVLLHSTAAGAIDVGAAITASGGAGAAVNNNGGNGAVITLLNDNGAIVTHDLTTRGGASGGGAGTAGTDGTIQLSASAGITQSVGTTLEAANLKVIAGGDTVLTNLNDVDILAASLSAGNFSFRDRNSVTIDTVPEITSLLQTRPVVNGITTAGGSIAVSADQDVLGTSVGDISSSGGAVTITADADSNNSGTIQMSGDITAGAGAVTFSLADCDGWLGATTGTGDGEVVSASNINKNGSGALRLNGASNNFTGRTTVFAGALIVNGTLTDTDSGSPEGGDVFVESGALLGGGDGSTTGTINALILIESGGILDPGDLNPADCSDPRPGQLTVNAAWMEMEIGSTLRVQLNGLTAGSQYDQLVLNLTGNVLDIGGDDFGDPDAGANLDVTAGYAMPVGAEHTIIVYQPNPFDLIDQRFRDSNNAGATLDEGDFFYSGGTSNLLNISYYTKSEDNDVTLTHPGRYDFDGYHGYTETNYEGISPFTLKTGANSAGWQTLPPQYFERQYTAVPPCTAIPEPLLRLDGHSTDNVGTPLTFEVDVVAGKAYEVMILTGDSVWNHDREQFTVSDPNAGGSSSTQTVSTWGAGALDGSGVVVTSGGGITTSCPGYYRWVRLTTGVIVDAVPLDSLGTILMTMQDLGGYDSATVILALDIRPLETVGEIVLERTASSGSGADPTSPFGELPADGMTVDTYQGTGVPPGSTITITVSAVAPDSTVHYATVLTDADPSMFGTQVTADSSGLFLFSVQRPATLADTAAATENWTVLAEERSGLSRGSALQTYGAPAAEALRFDFGVYGSPVQTYGTPTKSFLEVIPQTTYNATRGYGWMSRVAGAWRKVSRMSDLRTDLNYARDATFRVDLPDGNYSVRIYHSNPLYYGTVPYIADNFNVTFGDGTGYSVDSATVDPNVVDGAITPGATYIWTGTTTVSGGALTIRFRDLGGRDGNFVVSGIDISTATLPAEQALLASGDPRDSGAAAISVDQLQPVVAEAAARWSAAGLTAEQTARLAGVQYAVADLGGAYLGRANPATNEIRVDDDAAMMGWALGKYEVRSTKYEAISGSSFIPHPSSLDLLTVVMHELGHLLGYGHSDDADDLMAPVLSVKYEVRSGKDEIAETRFDGSSFILGPSSFLPDLAPRMSPPASHRDDVFAELGGDGALLTAATVRPSEEATQAKVPRRSRLQRYERELDAWFAELAAEEAGR